MLFDRVDQKTRERRFLEIAQSVGSALPAGDFDQPDPPGPDAIFHLGDECLGVEVRELFRPGDPADPRPQQSVSEREQVTSRAERRYDGLGGPPVYVGLYFAPALLSKAIRGPLADELARFVLDVGLEIGADVRLKRFPPGTLLSQYVDAIHIARSESGMRGWSPIEAGRLPAVGIEPLVDAIEEKAEKLCNYLTCCDRVILLLVESGSNIASWLPRIQGLGRSVDPLGFDQVLLLKCGEGKLIRLAAPK